MPEMNVGMLIDKASAKYKEKIAVKMGEKFVTYEVEFALMRHPSISQAAVLGVPDEKWGGGPQGGGGTEA